MYKKRKRPPGGDGDNVEEGDVCKKPTCGEKYEANGRRWRRKSKINL